MPRVAPQLKPPSIQLPANGRIISIRAAILNTMRANSSRAYTGMQYDKGGDRRQSVEEARGIASFPKEVRAMYMRFLVLAVICIMIGSAVLAQEIPPVSAESSSPMGLCNRMSAEELAVTTIKRWITITSHKDQQSVALEPIIRGKVYSNKAQVWVIVHPMETEGYWVQQKATVRSDAKWYTQIFIGREGTEDSGKHFEIMAVANPKKPLARGDVLDAWPEAMARSQITELIRE